MNRLKDFAPALKHIADVIERGIRDHPELSVGMQTEGIEVNNIEEAVPNPKISLAMKYYTCLAGS